MIVTSTRLLWKLQNTFPIQIIRSYGAGKALKTQRKDSGKGYWVIQVIEHGEPKAWFFRFFGTTSAQDSLHVVQSLSGPVKDQVQFLTEESLLKLQ